MVMSPRILSRRPAAAAGICVRAIQKVAEEPCDRILKSPSLVSLDILDDWKTDRGSYDPPSVPDICQASWRIAEIIDGKMIAERIRSRIAEEVARMKQSVNGVPGLGVIKIGQRRDSETYVRNKIKACEEVGIRSLLVELPDDCREDEVLKALSRYNEDPSIHGILVQLPLPDHLKEERILNAVSLQKDVDGFNPLHIGNLAMRGREPLFIPCTPKGCIELLIRYGIGIAGSKAAVIGRSNIVGLPMFLLLQRHHATVSVVHAFTKNPEEITRDADIVVSAAGVPNLVRGSWLKPGAVVIDVGTHPIEDASQEHGYRLLGDVCYEEAVKVAGAITPVPGGVGPMTIAMLLSNALEAAKRTYGFSGPNLSGTYK
ncbi:hypothetical protein MLD38_021550 [Melastoma candidum]|uniref:Uncharacterized protein n=1 Tax=Melastoma candidum TaxID=119954 RepID=A0ACB9QGB3_9MYRT|nr:hypothetical protein MLD38_021550 [Melastoma candidum]